jgi:hypothetical protein
MLYTKNTACAKTLDITISHITFITTYWYVMNAY